MAPTSTCFKNACLSEDHSSDVLNRSAFLLLPEERVQKRELLERH